MDEITLKDIMERRGEILLAEKMSKRTDTACTCCLCRPRLMENRGIYFPTYYISSHHYKTILIFFPMVTTEQLFTKFGDYF
jgi:hypothetical protein